MLSGIQSLTQPKFQTLRLPLSRTKSRSLTVSTLNPQSSISGCHYIISVRHDSASTFTLSADHTDTSHHLRPLQVCFRLFKKYIRQASSILSRHNHIYNVTFTKIICFGLCRDNNRFSVTLIHCHECHRSFEYVFNSVALCICFSQYLQKP